MSQKNLSDYLFDALERLNDPSLKAEEVEKERRKPLQRLAIPF